MDYLGTDTDIVVPETLGGYPVTEIGKEAFHGEHQITSIKLPEGLTTIEGSVTIEGKGMYTGTQTETFTIQKANSSITARNFTKTSSAKPISFSIGAKCSSKGNLSYKSSNKSVKVNSNGKVTIAKNFVGKAIITINAKASENYNGTSKKIEITVNPAGTKLSSVKNQKGKKIKVKWNKKSKISGYEIQYSTSKKFAARSTKLKKVKKAGSTSITISKLAKGKTYYVRIRTYKTVSGKKYVSGWSKKKESKNSNLTSSVNNPGVLLFPSGYGKMSASEKNEGMVLWKREKRSRSRTWRKRSAYRRLLCQGQYPAKAGSAKTPEKKYLRISKRTTSNRMS